MVRGAYNEDCMIGMKSFPDNFFDLAIVDPEYGRNEHGGKDRSGFVKQKNGAELFVRSGSYQKKNWDSIPAPKEYFDELFRVSKHQIIWGCNYFPYYFGPGRIIWDKVNDGSDQSSCEIAYYSGHSRVDMFRFMWRGMMQGRSITQGHIQQGNKRLNEKRIHPTQKPVALYMWLLQNYAKTGFKCLDTHRGSGSMQIACLEFGADYWGFEIDLDYFNEANERVKQHLFKPNIFQP